MFVNSMKFSVFMHKYDLKYSDFNTTDLPEQQ